MIESVPTSGRLSRSPRLFGSSERPGIHSHEVLLARPLWAAYGGQMATDPQMELRVSRLENDSTSLYELISDIRSTQQEHSQRFDTIDSTLAGIVRRLPDPS
jgi:hypothetical protein